MVEEQFCGSKRKIARDLRSIKEGRLEIVGNKGNYG